MNTLESLCNSSVKLEQYVKLEAKIIIFIIRGAFSNSIVAEEIEIKIILKKKKKKNYIEIFFIYQLVKMKKYSNIHLASV